MTNSFPVANPDGENLDEFFANIWRLDRDQIARLSPRGIVCAFKLAEIVYTAIRNESACGYGTDLKYLLAWYHPVAYTHDIDLLLEKWEEEVQYCVLRSFKFKD